MARTLVRLNGTLGNAGQEKWSINLNYGTLSPLDADEVSAAAQNIGEAIEAWWSANAGTLRFLLTTAGALTDIDVYSYGAAGPALFGGSYAVETPLAGSGGIKCPPQAACCISLLTGKAGSSYRGRVYWPALGAGLNDALVDSTMPAVRDDFISLCSLIEQELVAYDGGTLGVHSPTLGVVTPVTRVKVGNVVDTQRRRRDNLAEFYASSQYPA